LSLSRIVPFSVACLISAAGASRAWDGYDWEHGTRVSTEPENLVREGEKIEIYDWRGEHRSVDVQRIEQPAATVDVDVYDAEEGRYRTLEMEVDWRKTESRK
jgi:hypothetical protein